MPRYILRFHELGTGPVEREFSAPDDMSAWSRLVEAEGSRLSEEFHTLKSRSGFVLLRIVETPPRGEEVADAVVHP